MISEKFRILLFRLFGRERGLRLWLLLTRFHVLPPLGRIAPMVVYSLDSRCFNCGLADRLRGMVGGYLLAKAHGVGYQIDHRQPFLLQEWLAPGSYDWTPTPGQWTHSLFRARPVVAIDSRDDAFLDRMDYSRQLFLYSNVGMIESISRRYGTTGDFAEAFNELFRPSDALLAAAHPHLQCLGGEGGYVSVSFRFIDLLGDFCEGVRPVLPAEEQERLIGSCRRIILGLHRRFGESRKVLVTADSMKFLSSVVDLPFVYVVEGKTGHSGRVAGDGVTLKTFLDFYLISQASHVFLGLSGQMYRSHFAQTAAMTQGKPFEELSEWNLTPRWR